MPAYTFRRSGTVVSSSSSAALSPSPGVHGVDYQTGDLLLCVTFQRSDLQTLTALTGWTQLYTYTTTGGLEIWARIADGGANDTPSVDWSGTSRSVAWIDVFYGDVYTTLASIVQDTGTIFSSSSALVPPLGSLTVTANNCLIYGVALHKATAVSTSTAVTHSALTLTGSYINQSASGLHCGAAYQQQTTATNYGGTDFSLDGTTESQRGIGIVLSLKTLATAPGWTTTPSLSSTTATAYTTAFTADSSCTIYGVAVVAGSAAPSIAQVKAGQNGSGGTAKASNSKSVTGADTLVLTPTDAPVSATYDLYFVLSNASGDSSRQSLTGQALNAPAFTVPATVTSQTATVYTLGFTPDAACTIYGVAVVAGSTAPSVAQIKAGQNGSGGAAKASNSKAITGADTLTLTPSDSPAFPRYDLYCVLSGNTGDSARRTLASEYLDPPTGKLFTTLTSLDTTSPFYGTGAAIGDTAVLDSVTTSGAYAVTCDVDGTVSYAAGGDTSRQLVAANVYDYSAAGYLGAGTLVFNNLAPTAGGPVFPSGLLFQKSAAISPLDITTGVTDPEGDGVTGTALDALPTGLTLVANSLSGTPTTYGDTSVRLQWEDTYGATYIESVLFRIGAVTPNVVGSAQAAAVASVAAVASLTSTIVNASSSSVASGDVISQSPVAGTVVPYNDTIVLTVSTGSAVTITTTTLANGTRGAVYTAGVTADGEVTTWSVDAGNLPPGLTLDGASGIISGTPTVAGTYSFTIGATNGVASDTQALTLTIAGVAPSITTTALTRAILGEAYTAQIAATGDATITFSLTGLLPAGLSLSESGAITGTPTEVGGSAFTVTATNAEGSDVQALGLSVVSPDTDYVFTIRPRKNRIKLRRQ